MSGARTPVWADDATYKRPTLHRPASSQVDSESDKSSAVRRADLSPSIPPRNPAKFSIYRTPTAIMLMSHIKYACVRACVRQTPLRCWRQLLLLLAHCQRREDVGTANTPEVCRRNNSEIREY